MFVYLNIQVKDLYRLKGVVWIDGKDEKYILQSVGKRLDLEPNQKWNSTEVKRSTVVFIGKNLQRKGLGKLLERCLIPKV